MSPTSPSGGRWSLAATWLFAAIVAVRTLQSVVCLVDPRGIAASADGIPLDRYPAAAAQTIASLFALNSYGRLVLCLLAALLLFYKRGLLPWLMGAFLADQIGRRALLRVLPFVSIAHPPGDVVSWILIASNALAIAMFLMQSRSPTQTTRPSGQDKPASGVAAPA